MATGVMLYGTLPPVIWFDPMRARSATVPMEASKPLTAMQEPPLAQMLVFTPWSVYSYAMRSSSSTGMPVISAYSSMV